MTWMLYGAYGYTGKLIIDVAKIRGHKPLLCGRNAQKLREMAEQYDIDYEAFALEDQRALDAAVAKVDLVLHVAGPFAETGAPMREACLRQGVHYLDITGELAVFDATLSSGERAKKRNICLMSGVGFDIVPTDCLGRYVADKVPDANWLEIGFAGAESMSGGTMQSGIEMLKDGNKKRRDGILVPEKLIGEGRRVQFPDRPHTLHPIPWGDLVTAYHTTGVPNITTYAPLPPLFRGRAAKVFNPLAVGLRSDYVRRGIRELIQRTVKGPGEATRQNTQAKVWAYAKNDRGQSATAFLELGSPYSFTADAAVRIVERVLDNPPIGATTPARAFGADFVLELPGVRRTDGETTGPL